jgi:anti-sigma-K factor RskA
VSGCASHGELIGGYVLGALEPAELEAMERHLEGCPACAAEVRELGGLPQLLDRIEPADVPPPALSPELEEAVLDRYAREHRRDRARGQRGSRGRRLLRWAPAAVALLAALVLALVLLPSGDDSDSTAYATVRLAPPPGGAPARGVAYADAVPAGTRVRLWARGLKRERGAVYELWCVRTDGRWVSGGTFGAGRDGRAQAELTAAVKPGDYHLMVVTRRSGRRAEGARGTAVLRGKLRY